MERSSSFELVRVRHVVEQVVNSKHLNQIHFENCWTLNENIVEPAAGFVDDVWGAQGGDKADEFRVAGSDERIITGNVESSTCFAGPFLQ